MSSFPHPSPEEKCGENDEHVAGRHLVRVCFCGMLEEGTSMCLCAGAVLGAAHQHGTFSTGQEQLSTATPGFWRRREVSGGMTQGSCTASSTPSARTEDVEPAAGCVSRTWISSAGRCVLPRLRWRVLSWTFSVVRCPPC